MRVLVSTGAVTRHPSRTNHALIAEYGPRLGGDGLELLAYPSWYERATEVAADLRATGLAFPVLHADKTIGSELPRRPDEALRALRLNCELAVAVGATTVALHLWDLPDSDRLLERNLAALPACLDVADEHGLTLAVETTPCDEATPLANVRRALERDARCRVTLDTEFLAMHGELEAAPAAEWLRDAVAHVHVKDYDGAWHGADGRRRYLFPGEGTLDLSRFVHALGAGGYRGAITLETPAIDAGGTERLDAHRAAVEWLRATASAAAA